LKIFYFILFYFVVFIAFRQKERERKVQNLVGGKKKEKR